MNFEKVIRTELESLLRTHGFKVAIAKINSVNFHSAYLNLKFIYNPREYSFNYWVKHVDYEKTYENWVVEKFLHIEREAFFGEASQEQKAIRWVKWIAQYFRENQRKFLNGDDKFFGELNSFFSELTSDYNNDIQLGFIKNQIRDAWQQNDYRKLAELEISSLKGISQSEMKKIEIAKRKIKSTS